MRLLRKMFAKYLICVFLLLYAAEGKPREIKCPDYCKCDVIETLRRATCQNKKLYSIEIDIPPQAEVLDLSYNQISELGSHIFLVNMRKYIRMLLAEWNNKITCSVWLYNKKKFRYRVSKI